MRPKVRLRDINDAKIFWNGRNFRAEVFNRADAVDYAFNGVCGKVDAILQTPDAQSKYLPVIICHGFTGNKYSLLLESLAKRYLPASPSQGGVVTSMVAGELGAKKAVAFMAPAAVLRDDAIRGNLFGFKYDSLNPLEYVGFVFAAALKAGETASALQCSITSANRRELNCQLSS